MAAGSETTEYSVFLDNYDKLCHTVQVTDVLPKLVSKRIITFSDKQVIQSKPSNYLQTQELLDSHISGRLMAGDSECFHVLLDAMWETKKCDKLVTSIGPQLGKQYSRSVSGTNTASINHNSPTVSHSAVVPNASVSTDIATSNPATSLETKRTVLNKLRPSLTRSIRADDIIDYLIQERLIGDSATQNVQMLVTTPMQKNRIIVDELLSARPGALQVFCRILRQTELDHVANEIEQEVKKVCGHQ